MNMAILEWNCYLPSVSAAWCWKLITLLYRACECSMHDKSTSAWSFNINIGVEWDNCMYYITDKKVYGRLRSACRFIQQKVKKKLFVNLALINYWLEAGNWSVKILTKGWTLDRDANTHADLDLWSFDLILNGQRGLMMDYFCGKLGDCSFSRFGSIAFNVFALLWPCDLDFVPFDLILIKGEVSWWTNPVPSFVIVFSVILV